MNSSFISLSPTRLRKLTILLYTVLMTLSSNAHSAVTGYAWPTSSATFHTGLLPTTDPVNWQDEVEEATARWNDTPSALILSTDASAGLGNCTSLGDNNISFSSDNCGDAFGANTLAITGAWTSGSTLVKADIIVNSNFAWDAYDTAIQNNPFDFRRILVHEIGHAIGLDHPSLPNVIMSASANDTFLPAQNDIDSLTSLYGNATQTLTLVNSGGGSITITPRVEGTLVDFAGEILTSDYSSMNCSQPSCTLTIQKGLRLDITAEPDSNSNFDSWTGSSITTPGILLSALTSDRTLTANYSLKLEFDSDGDNIEDALDNCPDTANPDQQDTYGQPGLGDACEEAPASKSSGTTTHYLLLSIIGVIALRKCQIKKKFLPDIEQHS